MRKNLVNINLKFLTFTATFLFVITITFSQSYLVSYSTNETGCGSWSCVGGEGYTTCSSTMIDSDPYGKPIGIWITGGKAYWDEFCGFSIVCSTTDYYSLPDENCYSNSISFGVCDGSVNINISWQPDMQHLSSSAGTYCMDQKINLVANVGFGLYQWQYRIGNGSWQNYITSSQSSLSLGLEDIFGPSYPSFIGSSIYFRYSIPTCDINSVSSSPIGPYVFNPIRPVASTSTQNSPSCRDFINGKVSITSINRSILSGEILTYTVYKLDNTPVAQISSNVTPTASTPLIIDGSNSSVAPQGIGHGDYKILVESNKSLCGAVTYYTVPTIINPTQVSFSSAFTQPSCNGGNNGTITLTASGGTGPYVYSKGGVEQGSNPVFISLTQGTYNMRVKDAHGCLSAIAPATVTQPTVITLSSAAVTSDYHEADISCNGLSDGVITVSASGGTGTLMYSRDDISYQPSGVLAGVGAGSYTIYVKDANSCKVTGPTVSLIAPPPITATATSVNPLCFGQNGSINVSASGGTNALQYSRNGTDFFSSNSFINVPADTYTITIKDANNCSITRTATVAATSEITLTPTVTSVTCFGGNDGKVTLSAINGTGPYKYSFSGSTYDFPNEFLNKSAGSYGIGVEDANGCTKTDNVIITSNFEITGTITVQTPIGCNGGTNGALNLTPGGGVTPYTYSWSSGPTTEDINGLVAGHYEVTIRDSKNCPKVIPYDLAQPSPITITHSTSDYSGNQISCFGGSNGSIDLSVNGGNGGYTYIWSTGATMQDLSNLTQGTYTVTIKDIKNCPGNASVTLTQPQQLVTNLIARQNVLCFGKNTGSFNMSTMGGTTAYQYSINGGANWQSTPSFIDLTANTYNVLTKDFYNCQHNLNVDITSPPDIVLQVSNIVNTTCNQNNGSALASATGGVAAYNYEWFNSSNVSIGTSAAINNLQAGSYKVIITDQNACTKDKIIPINSSDGPQVTNGTIIGATCSDTNDGAAAINITGGTTPYTIAWPNGEITPGVIGLPGGSYFVEVRDQTNCLSVYEIIVPSPEELTINTTTKADPNCNGNSDGAITIEAGGGNGSFSYQWNTGATSASLSNIPAGTYIITVTDLKNCQADEVIILTNPPVFTIELGPDQKICEGMDVTLTAAEEDATYAWSSPNGFTSTDQTVQLNQQGLYTLIVTTIKGCEASDSFELTYDTDLLKADFLMASEAHAGDTIVLIDISWPLPQQTTWSYEAGATVVEETRDYAMIRYDVMGEYMVSLLAQLAQCSSTYEQSITILEAEEPTEGSHARGLIASVSAYPNPSPDEVSVSIELNKERSVTLEIHQAETGKRIYHEVLDSGQVHQKALNLSTLPRGMYMVLIKAGRETKMIKVVKK